MMTGSPGSHSTSELRIWWVALEPCIALAHHFMDHKYWSRIPSLKWCLSTCLVGRWGLCVIASVEVPYRIHYTSWRRAPCSSPEECFGGESCPGSRAKLPQKQSERSPKWAPLFEVNWGMLYASLRPSTKEYKTVLTLVKLIKAIKESKRKLDYGLGAKPL